MSGCAVFPPRDRSANVTTPPSDDSAPSGDLIRTLLEQDCPALARESLTPVESGWDNATWRLGDHLAVRLPLHDRAGPLLLNEQRWLPVLGPRLDVEVPMPVHAGAPSELFPRPWSVVRWIPGETAQDHDFGVDGARRLAGLLKALHRDAPGDAPSNPFRGGSLADRREVVEERMARVKEEVGDTHDWTALEGIWTDALDAPPPEERVWLHGDLHPLNVVIRDGALAGILDWGDVSAGDMATDLACAWLLLDTPRIRREFFRAVGAPESTLRRAAGWALLMALAHRESDRPFHRTLGGAALRRLADHWQEPLQVLRREGLQKAAERARRQGGETSTEE